MSMPGGFRAGSGECAGGEAAGVSSPHPWGAIKIGGDFGPPSGGFWHRPLRLVPALEVAPAGARGSARPLRATGYHRGDQRLAQEARVQARRRPRRGSRRAMSSTSCAGPDREICLPSRSGAIRSAGYASTDTVRRTPQGRLSHCSSRLGSLTGSECCPRHVDKQRGKGGGAS